MALCGSLLAEAGAGGRGCLARIVASVDFLRHNVRAGAVPS